jgi:hypothetical protein
MLHFTLSTQLLNKVARARLGLAVCRERARAVCLGVALLQAMARNLLTGAQITDARVRPPKQAHRWTPVPGACCLLRPRAQFPGPKMPRGTIMLPQCNDRKLARASQPGSLNQAWLRGGLQPAEEQRAKHSDEIAVPIATTRQRTHALSCHGDNRFPVWNWEPSPRTLFTFHNCAFLVFYGARKASVAAVSAVRRFWISLREITAPTAKGSPSCGVLRL